MKKHIIICLSVIFGCLLLFGGFVQAQEDEDSDENVFTLEEITVTAQKREENQQKVPIAMEVISGEGLTELGMDNVDELLFEVSNVMINTGADGMRVTLRGLSDEGGNASNLQSSEPTVAVNIDGSYNNMNTAGQNLFDIERVEVLFGPQSTMYASNSPGGIINVVTASPKTDRYSANASAQYGTYHSYNLQAALNVPVFRDKVAMRAAASDSRTGTWSPISNDIESTSVRLKTLYQATEDLSFNLTGTWSKSSNNGRTGNTVLPFADQDDVDNPWTPSDDDKLGEANKNDRTTNGVSADISWDAKVVAVTLIPSYNESKSEGWEAGGGRGAGPPGGGGGGGAPPPGGQATTTSSEITLYGTSSSEQKELELRLASPQSFTWLTWIVGGTYYDSLQERTQDFINENTTDTKVTMERESKALFANLVVPIPHTNEKLRGTIGYRQSWDETNVQQANGNRKSKTHSEPDIKYGFEYDLADNIMLYGSYSSSYRMGGYLMRGDRGNETLDSYTAGVKSRFWENKLQVNLSTFYYDYTNKIVMSSSVAKQSQSLNELDWNIDFNEDGVIENVWVDVDPLGGLDQSMRQQGVGDFESIGVDLQTNWIITSQDKLNLSVSYLDSTWYDLVFEYSYPEVWPTENYNGVTNTKSPKWSVSSGYTHNFLLWHYGTLSSQLQMQYKSSYELIWRPEDDPDGYGHQEPYYQFNGNATFNHASGKWSLAVNVKNITNYAAKSSFMWASAGVANVSTYKMRISDPRTVNAVFSIKF